MSEEKGVRRPSSEAPRVRNARCPTLDTTFRNQNGFGAQGQGASNARCSKLDLPPPTSRQAAWCFRSEGPRSGSRQPIRSRGPREGRRPDERPGRGRRHLADNSQVSDKAARSAKRGRLRAHGISGCLFFLTARSAESGFSVRKSKTLENISLNTTSRSPYP